MRSRRFAILEGHMKIVLGCLAYVLEITASRSPKLTPERNVDDRDNDEVDESDPPLNVYTLDNVATEVDCRVCCEATKNSLQIN